MARRTFKRTRRGVLRVTLYTQEVELLAMTARDMMAIVEAPPDGDVRDRLYPRAYLDPTEETAQGEYDALVHDDLVAGAALCVGCDRGRPRRRGRRTAAASSRSSCSPDEEMQWLTAVNDARLVIGTALGVTEDADTDYEPGDPRFEYGVLYAWLTQLHFELVSLLLDEIGEAGTDDPALDPNGDTSGESGTVG